MRRYWRPIAVLFLAAAVAAVLVAVRRRAQPPRLAARQEALARVMGTKASLTAVAPEAQEDVALVALAAAEAELRTVEVLMSAHLEGSQISRFNEAPAGRAVHLSQPVLEVLEASRQIAAESDGAFDVTCRPLLQLWKLRAGQGRLPDEEEIDEARGNVGWKWVKLHADGAEKLKDGVSVDLGGIAKGCGIDRALEAMQKAGCRGALVDVGGDIRCFGQRAGGGKWTVGIRDPFRPDSDRMFATLGLEGGAVCTSGNYFRYVEISGRRYSHIVDPRTGRPADAAPSVTVVAPTATVADAWATALSVLGPQGINLLPKSAGIEAMIVLGTGEDFSIFMTDGFAGLFIVPPKIPAGATKPATMPATTREAANGA